MDKRKQILESIYGDGREETRLIRTRHGQLEYFTTMTCIERYAPNPCLTLELGAGTGAYSLALAQRGYSVTALELVDKNVQILREKAKDVPNLKVVQGDALDLRDFADDTFDLTLCLGPMYHIYGKGGMDRVLDEAIRVTKPWGKILVAFLSVHAILYNNYLQRPPYNFQAGMEENFREKIWPLAADEMIYCGPSTMRKLASYGIHTIQVVRVDPGGISSRESNPHVPVWNHDISLVATDERHTEYTDRVEIHAGWKTFFIWLWANTFYRHRQRKWIELLEGEEK